LTGTPIQNNTKELFTLLNYIEPDNFNSFDKFMADYGKLETVEQIEKLHTMLRPHFLRRMKDEVEFSIPPLKETVIEVGLTHIQQTYYKGIYGENLSVLAQLGSNSVKTSQLSNIDI
jgi:chromodomain-helicase-DNA-binding protein 7